MNSKGPGTKVAEWTTLTMTSARQNFLRGSRPNASGALLRRSRPGKSSACRSSSWPGPNPEARAKVEQAKADKLAELRAAGDQREVVFTVELVVTGVVRPGETADPASVPSAPTFSSREDAAIRPPMTSALPTPPRRGRRGGGPGRATAPGHRDVHLCSNPPMPGR